MQKTCDFFFGSARWLDDAFVIRDELHTARNCSFSWWSISSSSSLNLSTLLIFFYVSWGGLSSFVVSQDIASKVLSFSQQGPRAICVLSVIGAVSTATLIQPAPSHGAIIYEVCYYYYYDYPQCSKQRHYSCWCCITYWSIGPFRARISITFLSELNWQWLLKPHWKPSCFTR